MMTVGREGSSLLTVPSRSETFEVKYVLKIPTKRNAQPAMELGAQKQMTEADEKP